MVPSGTDVMPPPGTEAKMDDLATTLPDLKRALRDHDGGIRKALRKMDALLTKKAEGQVITDADLADLQAHLDTLRGQHQAISDRLAKAPIPEATHPQAPAQFGQGQS
jgi:chromosome segregation ATPase